MIDRPRFLSASTLAVIAAVTGSGLVVEAQNAPNQVAGNMNIREVRGTVLEIIDELQFAQRDYNGHRLAAIAKLNTAKDQLWQALRSRGQAMMNEPNSDAWMRYAARQISSLVTQLQNDPADYHGHKAQAIADLQAAVNEINQGLAVG